MYDMIFVLPIENLAAAKGHHLFPGTVCGLTNQRNIVILAVGYPTYVIVED
jgi:hypothetical protein